MKTRSKNLAAIEVVAAAMGSLADSVAFVGGATTALYVDDAAAPDARPTDDIDCVVDAATSLDMTRLEAQLRRRGFRHDCEPGAPICRWRYHDLKVDVMPLDARVFGFSNKWYAHAHAARVPQVLPGGRMIFIFALPYFFATKLEAFKARGFADWYGSKDLEDIVTVLDGHASVEAVLTTADGPVRDAIAATLMGLVATRDRLYDAVCGHLLPGPDNGPRAQRVLAILQRLARLGAPPAAD